MPEIVEVKIQAEGLKKAVEGETIVDVIFHYKGDKIILPITEDLFRDRLVGLKIEDIFRSGKHIVFDMGDFFLISHLRMTGRWTVDIPEEQIGHSRITFKLASGKTLRYSDVRVFGVIEFKNHQPMPEGADVWDSDYTDLSNVAFEHPKAGKMSIKKFILQQDIWTGLGNVYANETLRAATIHPGTLASKIVNNWSSLELLMDSMKAVLYQGYNNGGLSLKDWYHVDGTEGSAQHHLLVYKRAECNCGTKIIRSTDFDSRTTYYCPSCQRQT